MAIEKIVLSMRTQAFRDAFALTLETHFKEIEIVAKIGFVKKIIPTCETLRPNLLIGDTRFPDGDCFATAEKLSQELPGIKMIFTNLTFYDDVIDKLKKAGACGYFQRNDDYTKMIDVIQRVIQLPASTNGYIFQS